MCHLQATILLALVVLTFCINITGLITPIWYQKFHNHSVKNETEGAETNPQCDMSMSIREGLWQRHCDEKTGRDCVPDFEEWCDNLDYPEFNDFVVTAEIWGDIFLVFAAATIIRSKLISRDCNIEMVGAETGLGGVLMLIGVLTYAYADSEVGYHTEDLHAGWGLCFATGAFSLFLFMYCLCISIRKRRHIRYFPIDNSFTTRRNTSYSAKDSEDDDDDDDELLDL